MKDPDVRRLSLAYKEQTEFHDITFTEFIEKKLQEIKK